MNDLENVTFFDQKFKDHMTSDNEFEILKNQPDILVALQRGVLTLTGYLELVNEYTFLTASANAIINLQNLILEDFTIPKFMEATATTLNIQSAILRNLTSSNYLFSVSFDSAIDLKSVTVSNLKTLLFKCVDTSLTGRDVTISDLANQGS